MSASAILRGAMCMVLADAMAMVCGKVAVGGVLRLLNAAADLRALGQLARGDGTQICFPDARIHSGACLFDSIGHNQLPSIL